MKVPSFLPVACLMLASRDMFDCRRLDTSKMLHLSGSSDTSRATKVDRLNDAGPNESSADPMGKVIFDVFLDFLSHGTGSKADSTQRILEVLGDEGVNALLWNPHFMEGMQRFLQEGDTLDKVMGAELLSRVVADKGLLVGIKMPFAKKKVVATARILNFEMPSTSLSKSASTAERKTTSKASAAVKAAVNGMLRVLDAKMFLDRTKKDIIRLMHHSSVLRRTVQPRVMSRLLRDMIIKLKMTDQPLKPTIKAKMRDVTVSLDEEGRSCLTGLSEQDPVVHDDRQGKLPFRMGLVSKLAEQLGVPGFVYMLEQIQDELVTFLMDGVLEEAITASSLQQLLGATVLNFDIMKISPLPGAASIASWMEPYATVKCICERECPSHKNEAWKSGVDDPRASVNQVAQAPARCPSDPSEGSGSLPCCASASDAAVCVKGLGAVNTYEESIVRCKMLGNGWHVGQRCSPADLVARAKCAGDRSGCTLDPGALERIGIAPIFERLSSPMGYGRTDMQQAFNSGQAGGAIAVRVTAGLQRDPITTNFVVQLLRRDGFNTLLNHPWMREALSHELRTGTLLQEALISEKLTELMAPYKLIGSTDVGLQQMTINRFDNNSLDPLRLPHIRTPSATPETRPENSSGIVLSHKLVGLLSIDHLMPARSLDCSRFPQASECAFGDALISSLLHENFLLNEIWSHEGAILDDLLGGRYIDMKMGILPVACVLENVKPTASHDSACMGVVGGCPGAKCPPVEYLPASLPEEAPFVKEMKESMISHLMESLGKPGVSAMLDSLRGGLVAAMLKPSSVLNELMTVEFVRALMVGFSLKTNRLDLFKYDPLGLGKNIAKQMSSIPICDVLPIEATSRTRMT